jgi:hypothetical protein
MNASLARVAGMELQNPGNAQAEQLAVRLLERSILTQRRPWDAGMLAVRVDVSGGDPGSESSATSSGSSDSGSSADGAEHFAPVGAASAGTDSGPGPAAPHGAGQQQQQQQRKLCVELAAAYTSPSFAVGWLTSEPQAALQVEVLRQEGGRGPDGAAAQAAAGGGGLQQQQPELELRPQVACMGAACSWALD